MPEISTAALRTMAQSVSVENCYVFDTYENYVFLRSKGPTTLAKHVIGFIHGDRIFAVRSFTEADQYVAARADIFLHPGICPRVIHERAY